MYLNNLDKEACLLKLNSLSRDEIIKLIIKFNNMYKGEAKLTHYRKLKKNDLITKILNLQLIKFCGDIIFYIGGYDRYTTVKIRFDNDKIKCVDNYKQYF